MQGGLTLLNVLRGVKMKRTDTALLLMMDQLYAGAQSTQLNGEKKGWT